jgi:hypothetical protein
MIVVMRRHQTIVILLATLLLVGLVPARSQDQGPMAPPPKFEVKRIPSVPHPGPPPIPEQEIIQKFAANEDAMKKVYESCNFTQTIRIEELSGTGGKLTASGEVYTRPDGGRYWRVAQRPESNLKQSNFSLEDVRTMVSFPLFALTTGEIGNYGFMYAGQDKLDELNTYVFQVKPKQLSRTRRFFEGVIWVDDRDLAIVKSYGKFVGELAGSGTKLPFTMFETYRENFQEKYWLPTYTSSDDFINEPNDDQLHLRLVVHSTDFKLNSSPAASTTTAAPARSVPSPAQPAGDFPPKTTEP